MGAGHHHAQWSRDEQRSRVSQVRQAAGRRDPYRTIRIFPNAVLADVVRQQALIRIDRNPPHSVEDRDTGRCSNPYPTLTIDHQRRNCRAPDMLDRNGLVRPDVIAGQDQVTQTARSTHPERAVPGNRQCPRLGIARPAGTSERRVGAIRMSMMQPPADQVVDATAAIRDNALNRCRPALDEHRPEWRPARIIDLIEPPIRAEPDHVIASENDRFHARDGDR